MNNSMLKIVSSPCYLCEDRSPISFSSYVQIRSESLFRTRLRKYVNSIKRTFKFVPKFENLQKKYIFEILNPCIRNLKKNAKTIKKICISSSGMIYEYANATKSVKKISSYSIANKIYFIKKNNAFLMKKNCMDANIFALLEAKATKKLFGSVFSTMFASFPQSKSTNINHKVYLLSTMDLHRLLYGKKTTRTYTCVNEIFNSMPCIAEKNIYSIITASVWKPIFLNEIYPDKIGDWESMLVSDIFLGKNLSEQSI